MVENDEKIQEVLERLRGARRMSLIREYYEEFSKLVPDIEEQRAFITDPTTAEVFHFATSKCMEMSKKELLEYSKYKPCNTEDNPFYVEYVHLCTGKIDSSKMTKDEVNYYYFHNPYLGWYHDYDLKKKVQYFKWKELLEKTIDDSGVDKTSVYEIEKFMRSFKEGVMTAFTQRSLFGNNEYYDPEVIYQKYLDEIRRKFPEKVARDDLLKKRAERKKMVRIKKYFIEYLRSGVNFFLDNEIRKIIFEIKEVEYNFFQNKMKKILDSESKKFIYKTNWVCTDYDLEEKALEKADKLWSSV